MLLSELGTAKHFRYKGDVYQRGGWTGNVEDKISCVRIGFVSNDEFIQGNDRYDEQFQPDTDVLPVRLVAEPVKP